MNSLLLLSMFSPLLGITFIHVMDETLGHYLYGPSKASPLVNYTLDFMGTFSTFELFLCDGYGFVSIKEVGRVK